MKKLIITAHPSSKGFSHQIARKYAQVSQAGGDEVEILDLYQSDPNEQFIKFEDFRPDFNKFPLGVTAREKLEQADEYVFVFPVWWYDSPAILKNFFDYSFTAGFAYKYSKKGIPQGLLKTKTARIFCTSGGPAWFYHLHLSPFKKMWKSRLKFCGIKIKSFVIFGGRTKSDPAKEAQWLATIR